MSKRKQEPEPEKEIVGYRYVGDGAFVLGIPARNLNSAEVAEYGIEIGIQQAATGRILYEPIYADTPVAPDVAKE